MMNTNLKFIFNYCLINKTISEYQFDMILGFLSPNVMVYK
jgi:hypothetical protein